MRRDDFFRYVNEGWLESAEIPAGRSVIGGLFFPYVGIDNRSSQYDGGGTLRDWWSASSRENDMGRVALLVEQYAQSGALSGERNIAKP